MGNDAKRQGWDKVQIGNREYCFEDLPAEDGVFLSMKIVQIFGGAFAGALKESKGDGIGAAITSISGGINPVESMSIFRALLPRIFVNESGKAGERATFDHFQKRTLEFYKVMFFCIRYNFADFFDASLLDGLTNTGGKAHA